MKPIQEQTIDQILDRIDNMEEGRYEQWADAFAKNQPMLSAWLFGDTFSALKTDEKGFLEYLTLSIWLSVQEIQKEIPTVSEDLIGSREERNCTMMEASKASDFRKKLNVFFEDYPQEDLLAFVEDALLEDEDNENGLVTKGGRDLMFIALKTVIDVLTGL